MNPDAPPSVEFCREEVFDGVALFWFQPEVGEEGDEEEESCQPKARSSEEFNQLMEEPSGPVSRPTLHRIAEEVFAVGVEHSSAEKGQK